MRFPLIGRSASPTGLLTFRSIGLNKSLLPEMQAVLKDKVAAEMNSAAMQR